MIESLGFHSFLFFSIDHSCRPTHEIASPLLAANVWVYKSVVIVMQLRRNCLPIAFHTTYFGEEGNLSKWLVNHIIVQLSYFGLFNTVFSILYTISIYMVSCAIRRKQPILAEGRFQRMCNAMMDVHASSIIYPIACCVLRKNVKKIVDIYKPHAVDLLLIAERDAALCTEIQYYVAIIYM